MASPSRMDPVGAPYPDLNNVPGLKRTTIDLIGGIFCNICHSTFGNKKEYDSHYLKHNPGNAEIIYTCVACHKEIVGYPSFRGHCYLNHVTKDKYKCVHCNKTYSKCSILQSHIDAVHMFRCNKCKKQFSSRTELQVHLLVHKNEKNSPPYECSLCCKNIDSMDMCELHIDEHCSITYPCPICTMTFTNKNNATSHLSIHFGDVLTDYDFIEPKIAKEDCSIDILGGILCCYCDNLFKNRPEFDAHFPTEHYGKDIVYSCNICGKKYEKYVMFGNHCYFHIAKDRFECEECDKTFPRLSLLVVHTEAFHSGSPADKPFTCVQCNHGFKTAPRLREHLRIVHDLHCIKCPEFGCDMTFESPNDLILHQRNHKMVDNISCRHCSLPFTTLLACERHLDVHRKSIYICPICNKEYREKFTLLKHIPHHFESVLHICKICGKAYNARSRLVQHSKTHSDLRNHICSLCGKGFMKPHELQQHLNVHTGLKPYKCTHCPKTFASYPNWSKHLRRMHNIDKKTIKTPQSQVEVKKNIVKVLKDNLPDKKMIATPQNMVEVGNEHVNISNNNLPDNNVINSDVASIIESGFDSMSSEMSMGTYRFVESDESTMDGIDPIVIQKEWQMLNESVNSAVNNILELPNLMPITNTTFGSHEMPQNTSMMEPTAPFQTVVYPPEYGPDFINRGIETSTFNGDLIDLDDHILPHIDPLLTIRNEETPTKMYVNTLHNVDFGNYDHNVVTNNYETQNTWEPPIITKVYQNYTYHEELAEVNRLSIMNTDIF